MAFRFNFFTLLFLLISLHDTCIARSRLLIFKNGMRYFQYLASNSSGFRLPHERFPEDVLLSTNAEFEAPEDKPFLFTVRVLLDEKKIDNKESWRINSDAGFILYTLNEPIRKIVYRTNELNIAVSKHGVIINGKRCRYDRFILEPIEGLLKIDEYVYPGSFYIVAQNEAYHLINYLDIEDYIHSVLRWESWPGWPVEVNKVFAIACRSYLITRVLESKRKNQLFHIKNTNIHQTYNGTHSHKNVREAIEQTRGVILAHNKKPIDAMFDSCCGGIIPAQLSGVDFEKAPYLARTYPCTFCKTCKIYQWRLEYPLHEFERVLSDGGFKLPQIKDVRVTKKDSAGAVQEITVKSARRTHVLTGKQLYSLITKIKSFCYSIETRGQKLLFSGKGYGHHLGICQWGARRMIDAGWNFRSILGFYYPGCSLMELKNAV